MTANPDLPANPRRTKISAAIITLLARMTDQDPQALSDDTRLFLDVRLTSLNALELMMLLSDELGVQLTDNLDWQHLETLGTLTSYVCDQVGVD